MGSVLAKMPTNLVGVRVRVRVGVQGQGLGLGLCRRTSAWRRALTGRSGCAGASRGAVASRRPGDGGGWGFGLRMGHG
eukprot:scaffold59016_cov40-Phaeocystis_antarctica.AAC.2